MDLGTLGGHYSYATAINNSGHIVGVAQTATGQKHGFLYIAGRMQDLGTLGGQHSMAYAINANDEVVGAADTAQAELHAFRYAHGSMKDVNPLQATTSEAHAINDAGLIAGIAQNMNLEERDYIWLIRGAKQEKVNTVTGRHSGWERALSINNKSQMAATEDIQEQTCALLYSPR